MPADCKGCGAQMIVQADYSLFCPQCRQSANTVVSMPMTFRTEEDRRRFMEREQECRDEDELWRRKWAEKTAMTERGGFFTKLKKLVFGR